ncbi:exopolysaccharide biosynthesis protein [Lysobacter ciconiae]|uniref:Exopolysaccharide biosynthesis protein n=1 Tax=Novilysobacter ciconiae TaxID=2781022 RepID=A0A7S6ZSZ1_9GAMM|nr:MULTISPECIES: exopolysaccharide biosynthesis protein [Lysobacter]QOW20388.1 exopolysaccharide biosynthesis protein [Lysobacter ciconiae]QOY63596.1 exopolysaccharide biosynthesis protein [Lysobacter sp. H21R4]
MKPADSGTGAHATDGHAVGTRALLDSFTIGDPDEILPLGAMFGGLGKRSFGMLVFIAILPAFLPIPGVGGASGLLVVLLGLQLMVGLPTPWLPGFVARRGPTRETVSRFRDRISPWLARLERVSRPRAPALLERRLSNLVSGLLLVALGLLLCLPIPFTNYVFGVLLLLFALALLERDGYLMGAAWVAGTAAVVFFSLVSGQLATAVAHWIHG